MVSIALSRRALRALFAPLASLVAVALLAACGGGDPAAPTTVARVTIAGVGDTIAVGDRRPLTAALQDAQGAPIVGRRVTWTTGDASVATVDSLGQLTAVATGRTSVTATSGGATGAATFVVKRAAVARVTVDRAVDTLWLTRSHQLQARALGGAGETLTQRLFSFVSLDTSIVAITPSLDGTVTVRGARLGTTKLVARSEGVDTAITVAVVPIPVGRIALIAPDTVYVGKTATVRAQMWAPDGVPLVATDLAGRAVAWGSTDAPTLTAEGIADESAHTFSGLAANVKGWKNGNATVVATLDGVQARVTILTARAPTVAMRFFPSPVRMKVGETLTLAAAPLDLDSVSLQGVPLTYALVGGAGVVTLTQTTAGGLTVGRLDALTTGTATVAVTADGRTFTVPVTVTVAGAPVRLYPTAITAATGAAGRLTVIATDAAGGSVITSGVTYRSTNTAVATVDATGRVKMTGPGTAQIVATTSAGSATTDVTVRAAAPSTFHIDVRAAGTVPAEIMTAARAAAARWERVIAAELPGTEVSLTPGECVAGVGAVNIVTTGLVVYVEAKKIDGVRNILAYAGPCVTRDGSQGGLPSVGVMTIDTDDIPTITGTSSSLAADVIAHELGHVLGIGTLWDGVGKIPAYLRTNEGDLRFDGPAATDAAVRLGMEATSGAGVSVEDAGGIGTAGGHWRERVYLGELMTGYIGAAPNPLSAITVQSLADLGYRVTELGADIVSPSTIVGGATFSAALTSASGVVLDRIETTPRFQIGERLLRPKFSVDRTGKRRTMQ